MNNTQKNRTATIAVIGFLIVLVVLVLGMIWTGRHAQKDMSEAVRTVSQLYLDELAGRREQVVESNLEKHIEEIKIALGLMTENDLSDMDNLQDYEAKMESLFKLELFGLVDEDGRIYTSKGVENNIDTYAFDYKTISEPEISIKDLDTRSKKVVIAMPVEGLYFNGKKLDACFVEIDMDVMLQGVSMESQDSKTTFSNIYTSTGVSLCDTVLGGLAVEDNLLEALSKAEFKPGYSREQVVEDFEEGRRGIASFTYDGIEETLSYVPVKGTDWMLTYLVRESVISERISSVASGVLRRSMILAFLTALILALMFGFMMRQMRSNAKLQLEKETQEAENRVKHEEMAQRIALQEQLLEQQELQNRQGEMITALASDYRGVYYLDLDSCEGICYQSRTDVHGLHDGEVFNYLQAVTDYCNRYIVESDREKFLEFIQPDNIREGLKESRVISFRYMISIDGKESYETVRFAGVRHPEDRDDHFVHSVGACFADVDAETRKAMEQRQALTDALNTAEQASRAKTSFLSNMSHEIRTPMNAIIGLNSIALNEPDLPEKVRGYLQQMGDSAQHLLGIINDILDMSRIETGRMVIKNEEFSFARNLEQVNTIISGQCAEKGLKYECRTIGKIDDYYYGDGMKLRQVMINILGNAVKFTPEGGTVTFLIEEGRRYQNKATLRFTIRDTGVGMSPEFLPRLFDAFSQEESSRSDRYGSTGLGMPITKSIVDLMNGHIEVQSEKGVGTTFVVTVTLGESNRKDGSTGEGGLQPHEMSVLAIDDDPVALEHAQLVLGQVGINCEIATSGSEGIEMVKVRHARREDYDLLLVDWKMPELDGVETTRQIRSIVGDDLPIIILTSYNWEEIMEEAVEAGVDTFVSKPLFAGGVLDEFQGAFRKKNAAKKAGKAELKGRHILLAEDMPVNAQIITMVLGMRQMEADLAENGRIAVDKFMEHPAGTYDAILMDMRMPVMDGLEATKLIRASDHEDAKTIPIIALTANAFDEDVQRSMQAGLNAHLTKPVEPEVLFETLENLIEHE